MAGTTEQQNKIQTAGLEAFQGLVEGMAENYAKKTELAAYSLAKQETAADGYSATYRLTKNGEPVGDAINIPKDMVLKTADVKAAAEDGNPVEGIKKGEKYIDFVVETADADASGGEKHLYLLVSDLVKPLKQGEGIAISEENTISVRIDVDKANGLSAGANGIFLSEATSESAGAMSAADKEKLDSLTFEEITKEQVKALFTAGAASGGEQQEV